jgi:putative flippase GtrA
MIGWIRAQWKKYREVLLYLIFGVLTTAVNYAAYVLFTRAVALPLVAANLLAWVLAVAFAYVTNRRWVFESKTKGIAALAEAGSFVAARIFSGVVDTVCMVLLVERLHVHDMIAKILVNVLVIVINYVLSKLLIFRKKK